MEQKISARAGDIGELLLAGSTGFAVRKKTGLSIFIHFFLLGMMVILGVAMLVKYSSIEGCMLVGAIGLVFAMVSKNLEKMKKIKQSLEFMNALFTSALAKNYKFCSIVKNTGDIVFFNRAFQAVFPAYINQSNRKIDALFAAYNVPQEHGDKLNILITSNADGVITTTIREGSATADMPLTLHLEAIDRPTGFFLLRGK